MEIEKNDYYVIDGYGKEKFTDEDIGNIHFGYVGSVFFLDQLWLQVQVFIKLYQVPVGIIGIHFLINQEIHIVFLQEEQCGKNISINM